MAIHLKQKEILLSEEILSSFDIQEWNIKKFAWEILENIGQNLSLVKIQLNTVRLKENGHSAKIVAYSNLLLAKAVKDMRVLARQLNPTEIMKKGFAFALEFELQRISETGLCKTEFTAAGNAYRMDRVKEMILFSLLQSLLQKALFEQLSKDLTCSIRYEKQK